jgi:hypothetical protein
MAAVRHRQLEANGITMHVAEAGPVNASAPAVLFVHGFPELWYSWRHQMGYLAARGYRCVAPDLRGYGGTTAPPEPNSYTVFHIVGDIVALLDALHLPQVPARGSVPRRIELPTEACLSEIPHACCALCGCRCSLSATTGAPSCRGTSACCGRIGCARSSTSALPSCPGGPASSLLSTSAPHTGMSTTSADSR